MPKVKPVDKVNVRRKNLRRRQRNKRIGGIQKKYDGTRLNDSVQTPLPPQCVWRTKVNQKPPTATWIEPGHSWLNLFPTLAEACIPATSGHVPLNADCGQLISKQPAAFDALSNASPALTNALTPRHSTNESPKTTPETAPPRFYSEAEINKYKKKKDCLFSRFDEGIMLDDESWFSVTPEKVAKEIAERCQFDYVLDAFCGAGGNTIQFALTCKKYVMAIDIDPKKIELAKNNARVYGVEDRIVFMQADFFQVAKHLTYVDMVFLSPPWGGLGYQKEPTYNIENLQPRPATELMKVARTISSKICLYLPRNCNKEQVKALAFDTDTLDIKKMFGGVMGRSLIAVTAFFNC